MINQVNANVYKFNFTSIDGKIIKLSNFKGKPMIIVNTASLCGFTNQYGDIEQLFQNYADKGLTIIAVPSNDFGNQELSSNKKVQDFCNTNFDTSFILTEITNIKGENGHPFFNWVKKEAGFLAFPKWNFYKYLINREGKLASWYGSVTKPTATKVIRKIEEIVSDK
ncbi:glutathione peroxidase [Alphaproteobacteria bacterium]|nr:glutathione peroxidase [Alphaproteobacteria bacterium]